MGTQLFLRDVTKVMLVTKHGWQNLLAGLTESTLFKLNRCVELMRRASVVKVSNIFLRKISCSMSVSIQKTSWLLLSKQPAVDCSSMNYLNQCWIMSRRSLVCSANGAETGFQCVAGERNHALGRRVTLADILNLHPTDFENQAATLLAASKVPMIIGMNRFRKTVWLKKEIW